MAPAGAFTRIRRADINILSISPPIRLVRECTETS
jgi:hypothetical protein